MSSMLKLWHFYCLLSVVLVFYQFVEESYVEFESRWIKLQLLGYWRPGRFPGIAGNAGNHGNDGKFHESHKILNQIWRNINKLCLGKISRQKDIYKNKILWFPGFWICSMAKNKNLKMPKINRKLSKSKEHPVLTFYHY